MEIHPICALIILAGVIQVTWSDSYSIFRNHDCPGNDYMGGVDTDSSGCMNICDSNDTCAGFVFDNNELKCWPKSKCPLEDLIHGVDGVDVFRNLDYTPKEEPDIEEVPDEEGEEEGAEEGENVHIEAGNCKYSVGSLHSLYGHNDKSVGSRPLQRCLEICAANDACKSVTRNFQIGNCFLSFSSRDNHPGDYRPHNKKNYYHKESCKEEEPTGGTPCIKSVGPFGGYGGTWFSDEDIFNQHYGNISEIQINHGSSVDCIKVTYGRDENAVSGPCHGGFGGRVDVIMMQENEYITLVEGWTGSVIDGLRVTTNLDTYGTYGHDRSRPWEASGRLAYISGKSGDLLDRLSLHFFCEE